MRLLFQERTYSPALTILLIGALAAFVFPQTCNLSQVLLNQSIDTIVAGLPD